MKFSTILAVFAVVTSCALSGCRYDKARSGANGNGGDNATMTDLDSESGSLDEGLASERPFEGTVRVAVEHIRPMSGTRASSATS